MPDREPPRIAGRRLLRCDSCGRTVECTGSEVLRYTREGWPKCCNEVMTLFTEDERPASDDTTHDVKPLSAE
jgi:hypothetical protein